MLGVTVGGPGPPAFVRFREVDPDHVASYTLVASAGVAILDDVGRVPLGRCSNDGSWLFPGGKLEPDESFADCAHRGAQRPMSARPWRIPQVRARPVDNEAMEGSTHTLSAEMDDLTASVSCELCDYAFIAPINWRGIALTDRIWLDRGDRTVAHTYMASADRMSAIAVNANGDR